MEAGSGVNVPKGEKTTRLVRVRQEIIDALLARPPPTPMPTLSEDVLNKMDDEDREGFLAVLGSAAACLKKARDQDEGILNPYRAKGYAEMLDEIDEEQETLEQKN